MIQSACATTSRLCSITTTVLPLSTSAFGDQSPEEAATLAQVYATLALAVAVEHSSAKDRSGTLIDTLERLRFALGKLTAQVADRR
ncbi:hypothetical protein [Streptomyces sp. SID3343]|uniref:hypothetical protein n=1 Tax=Streptomyces sp. SID3343 TaxID=2690260 RepID=UPI0013BF4156|nr:hypothetical protein [Streptomyces sp. SID3343]MYW00799.1 hypothetical protein [Streptomyces sp. SID3343]